LGIDLVISSSVSKSVVMGLDDWARTLELAKRFKQKSLSKAIAIAIRKSYVEYVIKRDG